MMNSTNSPNKVYIETKYVLELDTASKAALENGNALAFEIRVYVILLDFI